MSKACAQGMFIEREEGGQGSSPRRVFVKKEWSMFIRAQGMFIEREEGGQGSSPRRVFVKKE